MEHPLTTKFAATDTLLCVLEWLGVESAKVMYVGATEVDDFIERMDMLNVHKPII